MEPVFTPEQEERVKELLHETLDEFFASKGKSAKAMLVTLATIIGSLAVILGGLRATLGWLGFHYLGK